MKNLALQANWIHPPRVETWLRSMVIGNCLNVCCGKSFVGETRIDLFDEANLTMKADCKHLPFRPGSFDTVICDPPFSYFNRFKWIVSMSWIAKKRFMISTPAANVLLDRRNWKKSLYAADTNLPFIRFYFVFDRLNDSLRQ